MSDHVGNQKVGFLMTWLILFSRVQHLMANIALRRTKTQMVNGKPIVQLPKRDVFIEHVKLSEEEKTVYEAMQNEGKLIVSK